MFFSNIFGIWAEELRNLAGKYWQGCQNFFLLVRRSTFGATFWKQNFEHFNFSGLVMSFPWQQRKIIFRVDKTAKNVSRSKLRKNLIQKKKIYHSFFSRFRANFFQLSSNNYRHGYQNCNLCTFRRFWGQFFFEKMHYVSNSLGLWDEKSRAFSQKKRFFEGSYNRILHFRRNI